MEKSKSKPQPQSPFLMGWSSALVDIEMGVSKESLRILADVSERHTRSASEPNKAWHMGFYSAVESAFGR